jgi:hypothetical protein
MVILHNNVYLKKYIYGNKGLFMEKKFYLTELRTATLLLIHSNKKGLPDQNFIKLFYHC